MWRYPLGPPIRHFFEPFHFTAGDQLVVPIGALHISLPQQEIQSSEWEKKKEQTNNMLGLTQVQKESYVTLCMCRLTLVWILAKLLRSYWNADSSWLVLPLLWISSHPTGLSAPVSTGLSVVRRQLLPRAPFSLTGVPSLPPVTRDSSPKHFVWFRAKTDLHSVTRISISIYIYI